MDNLENVRGKGSYSIKTWEEIRKGGGKAPSPQEITDYLRGDGKARISRDELIGRITQFFSDFTMQCMDEDTGEMTFAWKSNPTKAALARYIGISAETLSHYLRGEHNGIPYNASCPGQRAIVAAADFDIIRSATTIIEEFYEGRLGMNMNGAGAIFWLKALDNNRWYDKQELNLSTNTGHQEIPQMTREEIAARFQQYKELPEKPDLD